MKEKVYIHYGNDHFDPSLFIEVRNRDGEFGGGVKPRAGTGLWASPLGCASSWKKWCEENEFCTDRLDKHFTFTLKHPDKVLFVNSKESVEALFREYSITDISRWPTSPFWMASSGLDFDKMKRDGYVAMEISISDYWPLYDHLYGWDCDSIVIFYPDEICVVSSSSDRKEIKLYDF